MVDFINFDNNKNLNHPSLPGTDKIIAPQDKTIVINFNYKGMEVTSQHLESELFKYKATLRKELGAGIRRIMPNASDDFINQISEIAEKLKCDMFDVAALLFKESSLDPKSRHGSFRGLCQMNKTSLNDSIQYAKKHPGEAAGIDSSMTIERFSKLSAEEQMPYVKNYLLAMKDMFLPKKKGSLTGGELYGLVLAPGRVKKDVLYDKNSTSEKERQKYNANRGLDVVDKNGSSKADGLITKADLQAELDRIKREEFGFKNITSNFLQRC